MGRFSPSVLPSGVNPFAEMLDRGHESFDRHRGQRKADEEREWARKRMEEMDRMERERHADDRAWQDLQAEDWFRERGGQRGERPPGEPHVTEGASLMPETRGDPADLLTGAGEGIGMGGGGGRTPFGEFGTGHIPGVGPAPGGSDQSPVGEYIQGEDIHKYVPIEAGRFEGYVARPGVQEAEQRDQEVAYLSRLLSQLHPDQAGRAEPVAGLMAGGYGDPSGYFEEEGPEAPVRGTDEWFDMRRRELELAGEFDRPSGGGGPPRGSTPTYSQAIDELKDYYFDPETEGYHLSMQEMDQIARAMAAGEPVEFPPMPGGGPAGPEFVDTGIEQPTPGMRGFFERLIPGGDEGYDTEQYRARARRPEGEEGRPPRGREGAPPSPGSRNVGREGRPGEREGEAGGEGVELSAEELEQARELLSQFPREQWEEILREEGATPRQIAQIIGG